MSSLPKPRPLELSRDGGKTWEPVGMVGMSVEVADGSLDFSLVKSSEVRAWIRIDDPCAVVKMTTPCSQNDYPPSND